MRATIETERISLGRRFKIEMNWDPGDRSVGIQEGWEECIVYTEVTPGVSLIVGFAPEYDKPPAEWLVDQIDLTATKTEPDERFPFESILSVTEPKCWQPRGMQEKPALLGMLHGFCEAVTEAWNEMMQNERAAEEELEAQLREADIAAAEYRAEN